MKKTKKEMITLLPVNNNVVFFTTFGFVSIFKICSDFFSHSECSLY